MARASKIASQLERWDKSTLWHPFTQQFHWEKDPTLIIKSGRGVYLTDINGRRYLDGVSSLWVNIVGHRHPDVTRAMKNQLDRIAHSTFLGLSHEPAIRLGRELTRIAPRGLKRVFYSDNGATAVEVALKMAYQYWLETTGESRPSFLAVKGSYHGDTLGAVSVGSIGQFHSKFKPLLFKTVFTESPKNERFLYRCGEITRGAGGARLYLKDAERMLRLHGKKIAAVIVEPIVQAAGGMWVMPPGYLAGLARLARQHGVLLIADEVATGFGRTGRLFACELENVHPDFLCVAKGLTGGYSPLAATLTTERIYKAFRAPLKENRTFFHGHSYTAHPVGVAAARATLKFIQTSKLIEKTRRMAHILRDELRALETLPAVKSIRQAGLMAGIEVQPGNDGRLGARLCKKLLQHGIWIRPLGNVLVLMPPLVITKKDLIRLVRMVGLVIREAGRDL